MALIRKILGQVAPLATTETTLYTVPASTSCVLSSLVVCNRGSVPASFRLSISENGGATSSKDYLYYDVVIPPNDTFVLTGGITMGDTDTIRCYSSNANLSFSVFGEEV